jgi:hypothetical protein
MAIVYEHSLYPLKIDDCQCEYEKHKLEYLYNVKRSKVIRIMPKDLGTPLKRIPLKLYKSDGSKTDQYERWLEELRQRGLPEDTTVIYNSPNPHSIPQIKKWLTRLNWKPDVYINDGESIPQIFENGEIVDSIKRLSTSIEELSFLFIIRHRLSLLNAFLSTIDKNGYVCCSIAGFSSTLRYKHKRPFSNLPSTTKPFAENIRKVITVPDSSYLMCRCDITALEETTKNHYIYFFDKEHIEQMLVSGNDPYCDLSLLLGFMTEDDVSFFNSVERDKRQVNGEELEHYLRIKEARSRAKKVNFGCLYGANADKIAKILNTTVSESQKLYNTYWERNKVIKDIVNSFSIKTLPDNTTWALNPLSGFWVNVRSSKDTFAIINQSSGVYVFDTWIALIKRLSKGYGIEIFINYEYHDEILIVFKKEYKDYIINVLQEAIDKTSEVLNTNVPFSITLSFGTNYGECH